MTIGGANLCPVDNRWPMTLQTLRLSEFNSLFNLDISPGQGQQGNVEDQNLQVAWALLYHFL